MQIEGSKETAHRAVYPQGKSSREENLDFSVTWVKNTIVILPEPKNKSKLIYQFFSYQLILILIYFSVKLISIYKRSGQQP